MNVIELSEVWLSYRPRGARGQRQEPVWGLRDINLTVATGECVAIMGANGSGKSSLLRVASGIFDPTRGTVLRARETSAVHDLNMGQNRELTGYQALEVYAAVDGLTGAQWDAIRPQVIEATRLGHKELDRAQSTYSLGMLLRVQLGLALREGRSAVILDEVLAAADSAYRDWTIEQIKTMLGNGAGVLLASHDADLIRSLADRVAVITKGSITFDGPTADGIRTYRKSQRLS